MDWKALILDTARRGNAAVLEAKRLADLARTHDGHVVVDQKTGYAGVAYTDDDGHREFETCKDLNIALSLVMQATETGIRVRSLRS